MKKIIFIVISVSAIFLLNTCALEIANVIGPGGGWVFYDKGNYNDGWRYMECASNDFGKIKTNVVLGTTEIEYALDLCDRHSDGRYRFSWEIPDEATLEKMLECFTYGLTQFKDDIYYLSVNDLYTKMDSSDPSVSKYAGTYYEPNPTGKTGVVLYMNYGGSLFGDVKIKASGYNEVRVRPIRRF